MICDEIKCTGCGACYTVCPQKCISMKADCYATIHPVVDDTKCVHCNLCKKVCHNNSEYEFNFVDSVYAFRSLDDSVYKKAASGGAASEFYLFAQKKDFFMMGTHYTSDGIVFDEVKFPKDLDWAASSKYAFSSLYGNNVFIQYEEALREKRKCLFIGLPCQTASLKSYLIQKKIEVNNIVFVDLICHGTPNFEYLKQHILEIERKYNRKVEILSFRDKTKDYHLKCISSGNPFYEKNMLGSEVYGNAFLCNLIFRENCYSCNFARKERQSDITIGDFDGLGLNYKYEYKNLPVSLILINSKKGKFFFDELIENNNEVFYEKRPNDEPFINEINGQLHHPSIPHRKRSLFLERFCITQDFDKSVKKAMGIELYDYYYSFDYNKARVKTIIKKIIGYRR